MSPVQFVDAGLLPGYDDKQQALSYCSYHFRALEKAGCIEIVETRQRRGATEHIYGGCNRVFFSDEEFEELPLERRASLSRTSWQGLVARTDRAIRSGTFDARADRHLTWRAMELDERGWKEATSRLAQCFADLEQIREEAEDRLAVSGDEVMPVTTALLGFESPPRPALL
jgi:glycine/D-amino acid oxidase-like deaminating enzyme